MLSKPRGISTEYEFVIEAFKRGADVVSLPLGDYAPYDVLVQPNQNINQFFRVQVKTARKKGNAYVLTTSKRKHNAKAQLYTEDEIDVFATKIRSFWYIIPNKGITTSQVTITSNNNWAKFKNGWYHIGL